MKSTPGIQLKEVIREVLDDLISLTCKSRLTLINNGNEKIRVTSSE